MDHTMSALLSTGAQSQRIILPSTALVTRTQQHVMIQPWPYKIVAALQILTALPILEKDPCVTCISVHNLMKADFVADDILRGVRSLSHIAT